MGTCRQRGDGGRPAGDREPALRLRRRSRRGWSQWIAGRSGRTRSPAEGHAQTGGDGELRLRLGSAGQRRIDAYSVEEFARQAMAAVARAIEVARARPAWSFLSCSDPQRFSSLPAADAHPVPRILFSQAWNRLIGTWALDQASALRSAGADVRVLSLTPWIPLWPASDPPSRPIQNARHPPTGTVFAPTTRAGPIIP